MQFFIIVLSMFYISSTLHKQVSSSQFLKMSSGGRSMPRRLPINPTEKSPELINEEKDRGLSSSLYLLSLSLFIMLSLFTSFTLSFFSLSFFLPFIPSFFPSLSLLSYVLKKSHKKFYYFHRDKVYQVY